MRSVVYHQTGARVLAETPDPASAAFYGDNILIRRFEDVYGHVVAPTDGLIMTAGETFCSTSGGDDATYVRNFRIGGGDGQNGCWCPDPRNATPEYVGVRFETPVRVTGLQFATDMFSGDDCPFGAGPCGHPTAFALEASNDEASWTTLLRLSDFTGMRVALESPYATEDASRWMDGVFLSDRLDVANDRYFLAYRLVVTAFKPDSNGFYNIAELVFYGSLA
jgi:hypothetical protein